MTTSTLPTLADFQVGDVVTVEGYRGTWTVAKLRQKNLLLTPQAGGRPLVCPPYLCTKTTAAADSNPMTPAAADQRAEAEIIRIGELVKIHGQGSILFVITGEYWDRAGDRLTYRAVRLGGSRDGRYFRNLTPRHLTKVRLVNEDVEEVK